MDGADLIEGVFTEIGGVGGLGAVDVEVHFLVVNDDGDHVGFAVVEAVGVDIDAAADIGGGDGGAGLVGVGGG